MEKKMVTWIFESIECLILCSFLSIDLGLFPFQFGNEIKYTGIILCFFYVLVMYGFVPYKNKYSFHEKRREEWCIVFAAGFVLIADYFLLFTNQFFIGILFFYLVQLVYYIRLHGGSFQKMIWYMGTALMILLALNFIDMVQSSDVIIAICYGSLSIGNCFYAVRHCKNKRFTFGIILLLACDINVLIVNMSSYLEKNVVPDNLIWIAGLCMWIFYLPSQVLMATSVPCSCNKND